jgi:hypothetical protein
VALVVSGSAPASTESERRGSSASLSTGAPSKESALNVINSSTFQ